MKQKRLFIAAFLCLSLIMAMAVHSVFAQYDPSQDYGVFEVPSSSSSRPGQDLTSGNWFIFHSIWIIVLVTLFMFFRSNRDRKLKVRMPDGKKEDEKEGKRFSKKQAVFVFVLGVVLAVSFIMLLTNASWLLAGGLLFALGAIVFSNWEACQDLFHSSFSGNVSSHLVKDEEKITTFKDVGGLSEVIEEFSDVVSLYKNKEEAKAWGIRLPKGILLIGPPGCGKTLVARAVAGEAGLNFLDYSGAEIGSSYVRSGAGDIKGLFDNARSMQPCLIFFDEIDALGRKRGYDTSGEFDHATTELLHQMDGLRTKNSDILVLAATNREDILDEALLRPGRFDKKILVPPPDTDGRESILKIHTANKSLAHDVVLRELALKTPGFTGATLEQLTNEAAQLARHRFEEEKNKAGVVGKVMEAAQSVKDRIFGEPERVIVKHDFEEAILRVQMGPARKLIMSVEERKIVAYHEMGHAVVTVEKGIEILEKVTLMPRNWALGMTLSRSEETSLPSKETILARITSLLGGRAAEEIFLGRNRITTGGGNDFEKAEELARKMVSEWGMGKFGPTIFFKSGAGFFGSRPISEQTAAEIDGDVRMILSECLGEAKNIIVSRKEEVLKLAELLLTKNALDAKEITEVLNNGKNRNELKSEARE